MKPDNCPGPVREGPGPQRLALPEVLGQDETLSVAFPGKENPRFPPSRGRETHRAKG